MLLCFGSSKHNNNSNNNHNKLLALIRVGNICLCNSLAC